MLLDTLCQMGLLSPSGLFRDLHQMGAMRICGFPQIIQQAVVIGELLRLPQKQEQQQKLFLPDFYTFRLMSDIMEVAESFYLFLICKICSPTQKTTPSHSSHR